MLRAALAALIGIITIFGANRSSAGTHPRITPIVVTEIGGSFFTEYIDVGYFAPYKHRSSPILQHFHMLFSKRFVPSVDDREGCSGSNGAPRSSFHKFRRRADQFSSKGEIANPNAGPSDNVSRWGLACILDNHVHARMLPQFNISDRQLSGEYISTQLPLSGFANGFEGILCRICGDDGGFCGFVNGVVTTVQDEILNPDQTGRHDDKRKCPFFDGFAAAILSGFLATIGFLLISVSVDKSRDPGEWWILALVAMAPIGMAIWVFLAFVLRWHEFIPALNLLQSYTVQFQGR